MFLQGLVSVLAYSRYLQFQLATQFGLFLFTSDVKRILLRISSSKSAANVKVNSIRSVKRFISQYHCLHVGWIESHNFRDSFIFRMKWFHSAEILFTVSLVNSSLAWPALYKLWPRAAAGTEAGCAPLRC